MTRCKYWDCGWCYCKTGNSNDINGKCMSPMECRQLASQQQPQQHAAIEDKVMSNENMREEFEAWVKSEFDGYLPLRSGDGYTVKYIDGAWKAWKASRAALCVELPKQWFDDDLECDLMVANRVLDALDEAGINYK